MTETLGLADGITLRGEWPKSQLVIDFGGDDGPGISANGTAADRWVPLGEAPTRGASELIVLDTVDAERFRPGDLVEIEQTNDESMYTKPEWKVDWGEGSVGELNRVVATDGRTLQLQTPLNSDYRQDLSPRIRAVDPIEQVGIEQLSLFRQDEGYGSTVRFELAADVWIDDVVSRRTSRAHVGLNQVFRCQIEDSIFHDASDFGDGGRAYGVSLAKHTTGGLVANNTPLRPAPRHHRAARGQRETSLPTTTLAGRPATRIVNPEPMSRSWPLAAGKPVRGKHLGPCGVLGLVGPSGTDQHPLSELHSGPRDRCRPVRRSGRRRQRHR